MRLFVGIFPDDQLKDYFRDLKQQLSKFKRNFKFVPSDQTHLTIKFLGNNIDPELYEVYQKRLVELVAGVRKFEYKIKAPSFGFQSQVIPRILFCGIEENEEISFLTDIATNTAKDIANVNIQRKKEHKKLIHHYTLARTKSHTSRTFAKSLNEKLITFEPPKFKSTASALSIVESNLTSTGPVYKIIKNIELK